MQTLLGWLLVCSCVIHIRTANIPSQVVELNDKFLQVKNEGLWFVEFYAPWCAHCKRLMPVWEHVGHALADRNSPVRVAKLDCTRYTAVASALNIRGYPTLIFFRNGQKLPYEGERKKEAMVDFALKSAGPVVGTIETYVELSQLRRTVKEPFFVFFSASANEESELYEEYSWVAGQLFSSCPFYRTFLVNVPQTLSLTRLPAVVVFKDETLMVHDPDTDGNLTSWIRGERWSLMPLVTTTNVKEMGAVRLLVLSVINMIDRKNTSTDVGRFQTMMVAAATAVRSDPRLVSKFQFGWLDGNEMANNVVLGTVNEPDMLVLNVSSYEYYVSGDVSSEVTVKSVLALLERIAAGEVERLGGRSIPQRFKRIVYEVTTNVYEMFRAQPLMTVCLFGVPLAFLSLITYCICSTDFSVDRDEIYPDEEETDVSDTENHEKAD